VSCEKASSLISDNCCSYRFLDRKERNCCGKKEQIFSLKILTNEKKTGEELKDAIAQSKEIDRKRVIDLVLSLLKNILLLVNPRQVIG